MSEQPEQRRVLEDPDGDEVTIVDIQVNEEVEHPWSEVSATAVADWQQREHGVKLKDLQSQNDFHEHARSSKLGGCQPGRYRNTLGFE